MQRQAARPGLQLITDYASIDEMASELGVARIWGGMHFRTSLHDGRVLGRQTAKYVLRHQFRERH